MNLNVCIICVAAIALLAVPVMADNNTATISGGVYSWNTFEPLENAVVEVNSTPSQSMVAKYGVYSFELEPGNYLIRASYYQNSTLIYSAEEPIKVKGEGSYVLDLLLLPVYSSELMDSSEVKENSSTIIRSVSNNSDAVSNNSGAVSNNSDTINNLDVNNASANVSITETGGKNGSVSLTGYYFITALVLSLVIAGGYSLKKYRSAEKSKPESARMERNQSGTNKLEKNRLLEEKAEYGTERVSVPVRTLEFSSKEPALAKASDEGIEPKTEQNLSLEPIGTQLPEKAELGMGGKEKLTENRKGQLVPEIEPTVLKQEIEEDKEAFAEKTSSEEGALEEISIKEPAKEPDAERLPEPETPVLKKNLPLPADLQEIMDIIRGQGGRITQKDLRSKLKYSEGKVSLMLADLERRELIEKFKRGRGNIVILRDEER